METLMKGLIGLLVVSCSDASDGGQPQPGGAGGAGAGDGSAGTAGDAGSSAAGGSSGTMGGGSGGTSGSTSGGTGGTATCTERARRCYDSCATTARLLCPNFLSHAECDSLCNQAYVQVPACTAEWDANVDCGISSPRQSCTATDPCASQFAAWADCRGRNEDVTDYELDWDIGVCDAPVDAQPPPNVTKQCACSAATIEIAAGCSGRSVRLDCTTWEQWYCRNSSKAECAAFTPERLFTDGQQYKSEQCMLRLVCS